MANIVKFSNTDVTIFVTSTTSTQIDLTCPTLPEGEYLVTVTNHDGVSNSVPFSIIGDPDPLLGFAPIDDHVAIGKSRLMYQYLREHLTEQQHADSNEVSKLIQGLYTTGIQQLEDAMLTIVPKLSIDDMTGFALDGIGEVVGQNRNGLSDIAYRVHLKGKIALNNSNGRVDDIYKVWNSFGSTSPNTEITEVYPASIQITTDVSPDPTFLPIIIDYINRALESGIGLSGVIIYDPVEAFQFSATASPVIDTVHGFGNSSDPLTGGKLATVII